MVTLSPIVWAKAPKYNGSQTVAEVGLYDVSNWWLIASHWILMVWSAKAWWSKENLKIHQNCLPDVTVQINWPIWCWKSDKEIG